MKVSGKSKVLQFVISVWVIAMFFATSSAVAQTKSEKNLTIASKSRPVAEIVGQLAHTQGWVVSYEDQPYEFAGDIGDFTAQLYQSRHAQVRPDSKRIIGPRKRTVSLSYNKSAPPLEVLDRVGSAYEQTGGDSFQAIQLGNRYVVMPAKSKDESGKLVRKAPILSTPISINEMERNGLETFTEFCKALSQASGIKVAPGIGPFSALARSRTRLAAVDEPARNVLARFLDGLGMDRERWILYNNPEDHSYSLSLEFVALADEGGAARQSSRGEAPPLK